MAAAGKAPWVSCLVALLLVQGMPTGQALLTQGMKEERTLSLTSAKLTFHSITSNPIRLSELEIRAPDGTNAVAGQTAVDFQGSGSSQNLQYRWFDGDLNWGSPRIDWYSSGGDDSHFVVQFTTPIQSVSNVSVVQTGHPTERNYQWSIHIYSSDGSESLHDSFDHGVETQAGNIPFGTFLPARQTLEFAAAAAPTPAPVSGVGDPHLTNMYGEHFDLYRSGVNVLLQIPRWTGAEQTLLRLEADARRMGGACSDVYFQIVKISGHWTNQTAPLEFFASSDDKPNHMEWTRFGKVELRVVNGTTRQGTKYLNVFAKNLGNAGYAVGGLLGGDSNTEAATPDQKCTNTLSLSTALAHH
mmetsp:Transcript_62204/g.165542  ORF Transcript_62204/g.165542 Transcript_62204/m.165542 type:complete len:357 (+) Transcript_62204:105-1175(+)